MARAIAHGFRSTPVASRSAHRAIIMRKGVASDKVNAVRKSPRTGRYVPITPALLATGVGFAALMSAVGGLLHALTAAPIPIARALREI